MSFFNRLWNAGNSAEPRDASLGSMLAGGDPWNLDFPLFQWSPWDTFHLRNAFESVAITGELGSSKTTGSADSGLTRQEEGAHEQ